MFRTQFNGGEPASQKAAARLWIGPRLESFRALKGLLANEGSEGMVAPIPKPIISPVVRLASSETISPAVPPWFTMSRYGAVAFVARHRVLPRRGLALGPARRFGASLRRFSAVPILGGAVAQMDRAA